MSGSVYEDQLRALAAAVTVVAPDVAEVVTADGRTLQTTVANARGPFLGLAEVLYGTFYNAPRTPVAMSNADPVAFEAALRAANAIPQRFFDGKELLSLQETNEDGRIPTLFEGDPGEYRLVFFAETGFFEKVELTLGLWEERHYHVPLLLSSYACASYRGS